MSTRREFIAASAGAVVVTSTTFAQANAARTTHKPSMKTLRIPRTDLSVSRICYGNAMLDLKRDGADFTAATLLAMRTAYEQGITFFDTADIYGQDFSNLTDTSGFGKAEAALGQMLKQSPGMRQKIIIQSKCSISYEDGYEIIDNSGQHILTAVEGSLRRLGTDHLDILLLHRPDSLIQPEEVAQAFDKLGQSGKVRYFGVSNFVPTQLEFLQKYVRQPLVTNQIRLGLGFWNIAPGPFVRATEGLTTVEYCRLHNINVQAYSPLRLYISGRTNPPNLLNPPPNPTPATQKAVELLRRLAKKYDATPAAIMLAWLLRHPAGIIPVIGSSKPEYIVQNCVADRIELTRVEWHSLLAAVSRLQAESP